MVVRRAGVLCYRVFLHGDRNIHVVMAHLYISYKSELWLKPTLDYLCHIKKKRIDLFIVDIFSE